MEYIEQNSHFWERTTIFEKNCGNKIERESRKNWKKTRVIQGGKNKEEKRRKIDANPRLAYISSKLKSKHARLLHRKVVGEETTVPSSNGHCLISYISLFLFFSFYKLIPSMWKIRRRENRRLVGRTRIDVSIEKAWKDMWRSRCERFYTWLLRVRICHRCCAAEVTITGMRRVDRFYFRSEMRHVSWTAALWKIKVDLVDRFGYRSRKGARVCRSPDILVSGTRSPNNTNCCESFGQKFSSRRVRASRISRAKSDTESCWKSSHFARYLCEIFDRSNPASDSGRKIFIEIDNWEKMVEEYIYIESDLRLESSSSTLEKTGGETKLRFFHFSFTGGKVIDRKSYTCAHKWI